MLLYTWSCLPPRACAAPHPSPIRILLAAACLRSPAGHNRHQAADAGGARGGPCKPLGQQGAPNGCLRPRLAGRHTSASKGFGWGSDHRTPALSSRSGAGQLAGRAAAAGPAAHLLAPGWGMGRGAGGGQRTGARPSISSKKIMAGCALCASCARATHASLTCRSCRCARRLHIVILQAPRPYAEPSSWLPTPLSAVGSR